MNWWPFRCSLVLGSQNQVEFICLAWETQPVLLKIQHCSRERAGHRLCCWMGWSSTCWELSPENVGSNLYLLWSPIWHLAMVFNLSFISPSPRSYNAWRTGQSFAVMVMCSKQTLSILPVLTSCCEWNSRGTCCFVRTDPRPVSHAGLHLCWAFGDTLLLISVIIIPVTNFQISHFLDMTLLCSSEGKESLDLFVLRMCHILTHAQELVLSIASPCLAFFLPLTSSSPMHPFILSAPDGFVFPFRASPKYFRFLL